MAYSTAQEVISTPIQPDSSVDAPSSVSPSPPSPHPSQQDPSLPALATEEPGRFSAYPVRQTTSIAGGMLAGTILGLQQGVRETGLRFRAENAHRQPSTAKGWYLYHKSKNYVAMWGGIREAARMSGRLGFWSGAFVAVEESVDRLRRHDDYDDYDDRNRDREGDGGEHGHARDALSTVVAGLTVAGAFSAWNRFPLHTAARTARMGLLFGLGYGLLQDAYMVSMGRQVSYVEFFKRRFGGDGSAEKAKQAVAG